MYISPLLKKGYRVLKWGVSGCGKCLFLFKGFVIEFLKELKGVGCIRGGGGSVSGCVLFLYTRKERDDDH